MKDDIHGLSDADTINVLDQAQGNKRCTTAVVDQERDASAVEHPCPIEHSWGNRCQTIHVAVYRCEHLLLLTTTSAVVLASIRPCFSLLS